MDLTKLFFSEIAFIPATQNNKVQQSNNQLAQGLLNGQIPVSDFQEPKRQLCDPDIVQLDWRQSERVGSGLINAGNTCFLNSVLQCLSYCPPLVNFLLHTNGGHSKNCKINDFCMLCEMERHIKRIRDPTKHAIKPVYIYQRLKYINKNFQFGRQEDAHEFLRYLIDHMWKACLLNCGINGSSLKLDARIKETTIVNHIFGGYHRSQVICLSCKSRSNTFDFFMDFILDIRNAPSLERALERFTHPETLQNENAYKCSKCKRKVAARKRFTVHKAPNVATFQLKRFDSNRIFGGKITKHISYPEQLDLRPYMSESVNSSNSNSPITYKLSSVLVHVGHSSDSGHYYCFVRNSNGYWYRMDDANVTQVSQDNVLNQQAYVLFYTRNYSNTNKSIYHHANATISTTSMSAKAEAAAPVNGHSTLSTKNHEKHVLKNRSLINGKPHLIMNSKTSDLNGTVNESNKGKSVFDQKLQINGATEDIIHQNNTTTSTMINNQSHSNGVNTSTTNCQKNEMINSQVINDPGLHNKMNGTSTGANVSENGQINGCSTLKNIYKLNGYSSKISTWSGTESKLSSTSNKRPCDEIDRNDRDEFNDELDRGRVKKIKSLAREERFSNLNKSNPFQQHFNASNKHRFHNNNRHHYQSNGHQNHNRNNKFQHYHRQNGSGSNHNNSGSHGHGHHGGHKSRGNFGRR